MLVDRLAHCKTDGVRGIHLLNARHRTETGGFDLEVGLERYKFVMDGGASGNRGKKLGDGVCMVMKLWAQCKARHRSKYFLPRSRGKGQP